MGGLLNGLCPVLGATAGVLLVGDLGNEEGDWVSTLVGSAFGTALGIMLALAYSQQNLPESPIDQAAFTLWTVFAGTQIGGTVGAVIGFNRSIRYDL